MVRVLMIDDDPAVLRAYARTLKRSGHEVHTASDAIEGLDRLRKGSYDVIFSDISMPGMTGLELLQWTRGMDLDAPVVLMTAGPSVESAASALEHGAFRYLTKPVAADALGDTAARAAVTHEVARRKRQGLNLMGSDGELAVDLTTIRLGFERAIDRLWISYQPIVNWPERAVIGYEARLRSDEPSLPQTSDLRAAAEQLGRAADLGRAMRALVAADTARAPARTDIYLKLNARDLQDEEILDPSSPLTAVADRVVIAIGERAALSVDFMLQANASILRGMGFRLAVDDMGRGFAGLTSLITLEPAVLKLDKSLISGLDGAMTKQRVVGSIVKLAAQLGKNVIAEGVTTTAERDVLRQLDCHCLQGPLFATPERGFLTPAW